MQSFRQPTQVDKTRRESEEIDEIRGRGMLPDDFFRREPGVLGNVRQIRTELDVITHRNTDHAGAVIDWSFGGMRDLSNNCAQFGVG